MPRRARRTACALDRLTHRVDGELRILADPPLIVPIEDLVKGRRREEIESIIGAYRRTLQRDRRRLLDGYR